MQRRPYQSGRTATLICPTKGCSTVASDLSMVEQRLLDALDQWLVSGTLPDPDVYKRQTQQNQAGYRLPQLCIDTGQATQRCYKCDKFC